ncbi:MAG: zf-HC2 domain-containing protein [Spirochaetaceae bacterium]|nr:zf-HC2 domain-containing protein [Spirochaetaceae bacterium]
MCPESTLLSSYVDNEIGPADARRVERHVGECHACRELLRAYQAVSHTLLESREPDVSAAGDRIWRRLDSVRSALRRRASFWTSGVRVPAPVAVALMAGVTLIITSVAMWARVNDGRPELPAFGAAAVSAVASGAQPVQWLEQGAIVIQLPDEPQFIQRGKPTILREAEFSAATAQSAVLP